MYPHVGHALNKTYTIQRWSNGEIRFVNCDARAMKEIKNQDGKIILREKGGNGWGGIGLTNYYPPQYRIGFINGDKFKGIWDIEYSKETMKEAKELAFKIFDEL